MGSDHREGRSREGEERNNTSWHLVLVLRILIMFKLLYFFCSQSKILIHGYYRSRLCMIVRHAA